VGCGCTSTEGGNSGGGGGGGPSNWQSFAYTADGLEGLTFTVTIPVPQPDASYQVRYMLGTVDMHFTVSLVDGSETVNDFDVVVSAAPDAGDVIHFDVFNP